ncbi:MAG TPA: Ig-like domain-containing protein [Myxococcota bacterium]|jgi:hypothetical protein|nr:Ig-like domain-containing protein [Myxococcota bacterium]
MTTMAPFRACARARTARATLAACATRTAVAAAALAAAACLALAAGCGPFPYDGRTGLRMRFESDLPWGAADTLRVWFTTPAGTVLGSMQQDLDLDMSTFGAWGFTVDAYAGDVTPGQLVINAEARAAGTVLATGTADATLVSNRISEVTVLLVPTTPDAPTLTAPLTVTSAPTVTLSGTSVRGAIVRISGGLVTQNTPVIDAFDGSFNLDVALRPNAVNTFVAVAVGTTGAESAPSAPVVVVHDDLPPDPPVLDPLPSVTGTPSVPLSGTTEAGAHVDVTGGAAAASADAGTDGRFVAAVNLVPDTTNTLEVTATDAAGNVSAPATAVIEHRTGSVSVDPLPPYTNLPSVVVTGTAASFGTPIEITGGAAVASGPSDAADGSFAVSVPLITNMVNMLDVHEMGSAAGGVVVTITHDDIAPPPPTVNPPATPTSAVMATIDGSGEAGAMIDLTRTAPSAFSGAATVDSTGAFFVPVDLAPNATNTFVLTQTDLAGNVSVATMPVDIVQDSTTPDPPAITAPPPGTNYTNLPSVMVSGNVANPGAGVMAVVRRDGTEIASTGADVTSGAFTVTVTLNPNTTNTLEVFSRVGASDSGVAIVTVIHDDVAPALPVGALITATVSSCLLSTTATVTGSAGAVEAGARVVIDPPAGGATVETTASATGSFTRTVNVGSLPCNSSVTVTAFDAAGNMSPALSEPID